MTKGFLLAALFFLAACGGGGGGGGGGGNSTPVVYAGNTNPAVVTAANASALTANVIGSDDTAGIIGGVSVEGSGATQFRGNGLAHLARRLNRNIRDTVLRAGQTNSAQRLVAGVIPVEQTDPCDSGSGSVRTFGTLNDNGTGTLQVSFNNCLIDGVTLSGPATLRVDAAVVLPPNVNLMDFTLSFTRLTLRGPGLSIDAGGSLRTVLGNGNNTETITENLDSLNNSTSEMSKTVALVFVNVYDNIFTPTSFTETINGRVFHSVHGWVDITTVAPLLFGTLTQLFPNSGQMLLTGTGNRSIRVTALSATLARLALDLNGDSVVDNTATLKWTDLTGPVGADLGDTDGDGMHNSWETANGLNLNGAADAALDSDDDGASSLIEYLAGTDPNNANSIPPFSGQVINLPGNSDLIFDSVTQKIYAAVRGNPGAIVPIDPSTGNSGPAIPVGIDPIKLARSDNGQYLYVGLDGENAVQRINLATQVVNLKFPLDSDPSDPFFGRYFAEDMEVLPGNPQSVAVSRKHQLVSPRHAGVAIYDDGVQRSTTTPGHTGSNVIEFSVSAGTLYGYNNESTEFGFRRMTVDSSGVSVQDVFTSFDGDLINGFGVNIKFQGGLIYTTTGRVIDPVARTVLGTFSLPATFGNLVMPDAVIGRVFFLTRDGLSGIWSIRAFDLNTRQFLGSEDIPGVTGDPSSLIRWGTKGFAFRTSDGQIFLIQSFRLIP